MKVMEVLDIDNNGGFRHWRRRKKIKLKRKRKNYENNKFIIFSNYADMAARVKHHTSGVMPDRV